MGNRRLINAWGAMGLTLWMLREGGESLELAREHLAERRFPNPSEHLVPSRLHDASIVAGGVSDNALKTRAILADEEEVTNRSTLTHARSKASSAGKKSALNVSIDVQCSGGQDVPAVTSPGINSTQNVHFSAVWGVVSGRKLAFWVDLGEPR